MQLRRKRFDRPDEVRRGLDGRRSLAALVR
jgi:hypothetical protein